jgi:hypothetical protein
MHQDFSLALLQIVVMNTGEEHLLKQNSLSSWQKI